MSLISKFLPHTTIVLSPVAWQPRNLHTKRVKKPCQNSLSLAQTKGGNQCCQMGPKGTKLVDFKFRGKSLIKMRQGNKSGLICSLFGQKKIYLMLVPFLKGSWFLLPQKIWQHRLYSTTGKKAKIFLKNLVFISLFVLVDVGASTDVATVIRLLQVPPPSEWEGKKRSKVRSELPRATRLIQEFRVKYVFFTKLHMPQINRRASFKAAHTSWEWGGAGGKAKGWQKKKRKLFVFALISWAARSPTTSVLDF